MNGLEQRLELIDDYLVDYKSLLPLFYQFVYDGIIFDCQIINHDIENSYHINLTAQIGYLPYSSENKTRREQILKKFSYLMVQGLITMDHHCKMKFPLSTVISGKINAKIVMETIFYTLLDVKEILKIIADTMQIKGLEKKRNFKEISA